MGGGWHQRVQPIGNVLVDIHAAAAVKVVVQVVRFQVCREVERRQVIDDDVVGCDVDVVGVNRRVGRRRGPLWMRRRRLLNVHRDWQI